MTTGTPETGHTITTIHGITFRQREAAVTWANGQRREIPAHWEYQDEQGVWCGHGESLREAEIDAVHARLFNAQKWGNADDYAHWLAIAWTLPLPASIAIRWDQEFRKVTPSTPRIPDPRRAPQQAIAWGMDPRLARTAKVRAAIARAHEERIGTRRAWWVLASDGRLTDREVEDVLADLQRCYAAIRAAGLAEDFGLTEEASCS